MGLLDTMLQNDVERNAPQIKPWNSNGFINSMNQYLNLSNNIDDTQRQNSILNLIAQREKDGIPYDRLADEVAKYDPKMAMNLQNQAQKSITWNRQESEAELANYKKAMAGWLGGVVLRRANEAVQNGTEQWDFDYVVKVCNECAAVIYPYDPTAAAALMNFGKQGLGSVKKASMKPTDKERLNKDDHVTMSKIKDDLLKMKTNQEATQDQIKIASAEYDRYNLLELMLGGRFPLYTWMTGYLRGNLRKGISYEESIRRIVDAYDESQPYGFEYRSLERNPAEEVDLAADDVVSKAASGNSQKSNGSDKRLIKTANNASGVDEDSNLDENGDWKIHTYVKPSYSSIAGNQNAPLDNATKLMAKDINNTFSSDKLREILANIEEYEGLAGAKGVESLKKQVSDKIESVEYAEANGADEQTSRLLANAVKGRNATNTISILRNFGSFISGYDSVTPLSLLNLGILIQTPGYKATDYDSKVSQIVVDPNDSFATVLSFIQDMDIPGVSKMAKFKNARKPIEALGQDVIKQMRAYYKGWTNNMTPEKKDEFNNTLKQTFGWDDRAFELMNNEDHYLPTGWSHEQDVLKAQKASKNLQVRSDGTITDENGNFVRKWKNDNKKSVSENKEDGEDNEEDAEW